MTQLCFFLLEPSARLLLNFKTSQHNSKQSLKRLHLYLHVNHVQSYSDKAPDTYFFKRRDVGRGAGRSTVIAGFSNGRPCKRFGRRDVHLRRSVNLKPKAPQLSWHLTWIRVCPNAEHHQQAVACWWQLDFIKYPMLYRHTSNRYLEAFWAEAFARC